jgi:hypothetical protein
LKNSKSSHNKIAMILKRKTDELLWDMTLHSLVEVHHFGGTYCKKWQVSTCFLLIGLFHLEDGGSTFLQNYGILPDYTVSYPKR